MTSYVQEEVVIEGGEAPPDGYTYNVDIFTGNQWGAGTDSNVLLTIYGENGDTGQSQLDNDGNNFERDSHDHFKIVHIGDSIGRIKKIKIGHDNSGIGPAWFLNKVMIEDLKTSEVFEFPCEEWFGDDSGGLLSRDLDYSNVTINEKSTEKVPTYTIHIYTGTEWGAGTDANVHVTIYGTKGDSEEFRFENKGSSTFEGGSKDSFQVETKESLGTIYKVRVGHDNTGWGPGWFLDKIEVEDGNNGEIIEFLCGKWLATDCEDGLIRRDLMRENFVEESESTLGEVTYKVNIHTGDEFGAGTDANILFTLYGTAGESEQQTFENEGSATFENGMIDTIEFKCPYLGTLTKVRIGHDNTGWGPAWFLDKVTVEDPKTGEKAVFPCNRWLATNADDGMIERELTREGFFGEIIIEGLPDDLKGEPLGIETGDLKDDCISASSTADGTSPTNARLNNPSGWCAKESDGCWLQVDLERLHCITSVATQGNPSGNNDYVKKYKLQYSQDGENWTNHEENGNQLFDANVDHATIKTVKLQKYIVARYIRFCPVEWYCWPSLRVEVYGVPLKEGETEVKTVSYVTEEVVETTETEENETAPDEEERAEDTIQLILSQTGDKRKDIEDQKQQIEDEMKELERERKEREEKREEELKRLEEEAKKREEEEERKREEEREKKRQEEEERKRKVELEVQKIEKEHQARLDELDKLMKEEEERKRQEIEEKKKADEEELKRLKDEKKKIDEEEKRLEEEKREITVTTTTTDSEDGEDRESVTVTTTTVTTTIDQDDERETIATDGGVSDNKDTTTTTDIEKGEDGETVTVTTTTVTTTIDQDDERETIATDDVTKITEDDDGKNRETTTTTTDMENGEDRETVTVTTTTQVIVETSLDDETRDFDFMEDKKPEEGYVIVEHENDEERKARLEDEQARERYDKIRKMQEEEEKRQKEVEELSVIMIERKIKSGDTDDERTEDEEERKKKEEAKKIKEQQEKEREEKEREERMKKDEKARRKAEKEKKKMLKGQVLPSDSLSSLSSSSSSSSSEDEDKPPISTIDKTPFRAPIASVDDEGEDEITKLVTYRTTTKTTTRVVSWPGTYFFKPIEPGTRQQHLPEDVGLLFGFDDVKPYKGMASCDHLKPEDPAVRSAQESSFTSKFYDGGPKPAWYGGLDTESTLPVSAVREEDVDRLVEWEKAGDVGWKRTKKSRDFEIWKRKAHEGGPRITKAVITLDGVPYASAIKILSDWKSRHEWDKTFDKVDVLESNNASTVVHCPVRKREYALAVLDRQDNQEPFFASAWRNTSHPKLDLTKNKRLKLYYLVAGLVIRPIDDGSQSSKVTLLCQVKGSVPSQVKSTFLAAKPAKWMTALKKYHARVSEESAVKEE